MKKLVKILRTKVVNFHDGSFYDIKDILIICGTIAAFVIFKSN